MKSPRFPSWQEVGLPDALPETLRKIRYGDLLNFILSYRVFLHENKVNYLYICATCSCQKYLSPFESYTECKRCGSESVHAVPYLTLNRKNSRQFNKNLVSLVCSRMAEYHDAYSGVSCPEVMEMTWDTMKGGFAAKFLGGDRVYCNEPALAVVRAAICCPFVWDGRFDFAEKRWKDQSDLFSLSHMVYQWCTDGKFVE